MNALHPDMQALTIKDRATRHFSPNPEYRVRYAASPSVQAQPDP